MFSRRKRVCISLLLFLMFALAGCGPPVPGYTVSAFPTPTPTGGQTGGPGRGSTGQTTEPSTESTSPAETTDSTDTASPSGSVTSTDPVTPTDTATTTDTGTTTTTASPAAEPIDCTQRAPLTTSPQASTAPPSQGQSGDAQAKPDFTVVDPPTCTVALGNPPEVADCLFVSVDLRNQGPGFASAPVRLTSDTLTADTGLTTDTTMVASPEKNITEVQVNLRTTDFGQTHELTITADPGNTIEEIREDNNLLVVNLVLPARDALDPSITCAGVTAGPEGGSDGPTPSDVSTETPAVVG